MINPNSRYQRSRIILRGEALTFLQLAEVEYYSGQEDDVFHIVSEGETLFSIAYRYYGGVGDGVHNWWLIAEYQPEPIVDPTAKLNPGDILVIPSTRHLLDAIAGQTSSDAVVDRLL